MTNEERRRKLQLRMRLANWDDPQDDEDEFKFDLFDVIGEDVSGLYEAATSPIQTAKGIGKLAGAASDIHLGTDLVDEADEEMARGAGNQFVDEIKNFRNRPFRALSNLATFAPLAGALKAGATAGKLGKVARVAGAAQKGLDLADPLVATGKGARKVYQGAKGKPTQAVNRLADEARGTQEPLRDELQNSLLGTTTGEGAETIRVARRITQDPERAPIFREAIDTGSDASIDAVDDFNQAMEIVTRNASDAYDVGKTALIKSGEWDRKLGGHDLLNEIFEEGFSEAKAPIRIVPAITPSKGPGGTVWSPNKDRVTGFKLQGGDFGMQEASKAKLNAIYTELSEKVLRRGTLTVGDLDNIKRQLDDIIQSTSPENPMTEAALRTLKQVRKATRKRLETDAYSELMAPYIQAKEVLESNALAFGGESGKVVELPSGRTFQKGVADALARTLGGREAVARQEILRSLEDISGVKGIQAKAVAAPLASQTGGGLAVKAEVFGAGRTAMNVVPRLLAGAGVYGALGPLASLPVAAIFSPKAVGRYLHYMGQRGIKDPGAPGKAKKTVEAFRKLASEAKRTGLPISDMTMGELLQASVKQSRRPAQQQQRLEKDQEKNIFRTLGAR